MREEETMSHTEHDEGCPNCGGEGVIYSCFEEWACIDSEGGCDLCERRCDWCQPMKPARAAIAKATSEGET